LLKEHPDWFHPAGPITDWNDPVQLQEKWLFNLPDFDQSQPAVREYILSYSKYWIEQTGVDGFRVDTLRHLPPEFVRWYVAELQKVKPGFWLLGESWESNPEKLVVYAEAGVPALLNFPVNEAIRFVIGNDEPMTKLASTVERTWRTLPPGTLTGGFVDNHDMERFVSVTWTDSVRRLKLALLFLLTARDIPIIYSGTEVALEGGKDPDNRRDFPWGKETHPEVAALIRRLNQVRAQHPALRGGGLETLTVDATSWAYGRGAYLESVVVVLNNAENQGYDRPVPVAGLGLPDGTLLHDAITGREVTVRDGAVLPGLGPRSGAVFVVGPFVAGAPLAPWFSEPASVWPWLSLLLMTAGTGGAFALWLWWRRRQSRLTTC
ncbi:MAG TPA: alpha-amylase family glycosyl hydrolase, partial [Symbiobacteriaceae bacterium]|nr:alpha-amylase family glycosyl hydrolase [Symbiobacteriaceae bacterium]